MEENKELFVKNFGALLKSTRRYSELDKAVYEVDKYGTEYMVLYFKNGSQQKINVTADSCYAMIVDFVVQH